MFIPLFRFCCVIPTLAYEQFYIMATSKNSVFRGCHNKFLISNWGFNQYLTLDS